MTFSRPRSVGFATNPLTLRHLMSLTFAISLVVVVVVVVIIVTVNVVVIVNIVVVIIVIVVVVVVVIIVTVIVVVVFDDDLLNSQELVANWMRLTTRKAEMMEESWHGKAKFRRRKRGKQLVVLHQSGYHLDTRGHQ